MRRRRGYRDAPQQGYAPPPGYRDAPQQGYAQPPGPQQGYPQQGYAQPQGQPLGPQNSQDPRLPQGAPLGTQQAAPHQPQGYEPAAAGSRPYYPGGMAPAAAVQPGQGDEGMRPPLAIGPGQFGAQQPAPGQYEQGQTGTVRGDQRMAAFPAEVRPETGPSKELPPQFRRTLVDYRTKEPAGTIIIDTPNTYLYLVLGNGKAMRYGIGVGREGFTWAGAEKVTKMAEWPDWNPPSEMIERQPYLPRFMAGGESNPLGARALYLGKTHLPHPRHQSAFDHRLVRVLGLHPADQRGRPGPLYPRQGRHPRRGAAGRQAAGDGRGGRRMVSPSPPRQALRRSRWRRPVGRPRWRGKSAQNQGVVSATWRGTRVAHEFAAMIPACRGVGVTSTPHSITRTGLPSMKARMSSTTPAK